MQQFTKALVMILMIPLLLLNLFGGFISAIGLLIGGDWLPVLLGIIFILVGTLLISILMIPTFIFSGLGIYFANRKNRLGVGFAVFLSQWWIYAVIFGVSYSVFGTMLQFDDTASKLLLLTWAFSVAIAPWTYMASKEQDNSSTQLTLFIAQTGLLVILVMVGVAGNSLDASYRLVTALSIFPVIFSTFVAIKMIHNSGESLLTDPFYSSGKSKYSQSELFAFVAAMLHVANSDGHLHPEETKQLRQCFKDITGERISKGFVERAYFLLDSKQVSVEEAVDEIADTMTSELKEIILLASKSIMEADRKIHDSEIKALKEIGKMMDLSNEEILKIIK